MSYKKNLVRNLKFEGLWFPKEILLDEKLTFIQKIVWAVINLFDGEYAFVPFGNELSRIFKYTYEDISSAAKVLLELGYIKKVKVKEKDDEHLQINRAKKIKTFTFKNNVSLSKSELKTLLKEYVKEDVKWMINKLSEYKSYKNKEYISDFNAIKRWVISALNDEKERKKIKEKNIKIIEEIKWHLEQKNKRGDLVIYNNLAFDRVLIRKCSLFHPYLPKIIASWYGWDWED